MLAVENVENHKEKQGPGLFPALSFIMKKIVFLEHHQEVKRVILH